MRFARRAEGIMSARYVFKLARDDARVTYHVYCSAALMEYFCSKDKTIGHKIFELGMKRFGGIAEYVLCYVDFMAHLNEDNNIRVLFERALGSNQITQERARLIWARFLQFESQVGDLASILKVEKRRLQALDSSKEFSRLETALLIDRYRFLDLLPCSDSELRSLGYRELARFQLAGIGKGYDDVLCGVISSHSAAGVSLGSTLSGVTGGVGGVSDPFISVITGTDQKPTYPQPDVSQMLPFKPKAYPRTGSHPILRAFPELEIPDDYMEVVAGESEELTTTIDSGTALSIELASTATSATPLLLAARKRRQQLAMENLSNPGIRGSAANQAKLLKRTNLNAFGDSEDEGDVNEGDNDDDDEDERAAALLGGQILGSGSELRPTLSAAGLNCNVPMDLYRLRQMQRAK
ncbi:unnamed protein product [Heterobilharzia americana]|nr:unnamed protein product [Heterobilharzia americana]